MLYRIPPDSPCLRHSREGFTLLELLIAVAIIAVLAAMLFAGLGIARSFSRSAICVGNLRLLGSGFGAYATDHDGHFPDYLLGSTYWPQEIAAYVPRKAFFCPEAVEREGIQETFKTINTDKVWKDTITRVSYGYNARGLSPHYGSGYTPPSPYRKVTAATIERLASVIVLADAGRLNANKTDGWGFYYMEMPYLQYSLPLPRHRGKANVLWADGHVSQRECILKTTDSKESEKYFPLREWYYNLP